MGVVAVLWWRGNGAWTSGSALFLAMVLLSPAAHPWYLLWALVLLPIVRSPAVWVASLTLPWGYAVLADPVDWTLPRWVMVVAYVPVYAAIALEIATARSQLRWGCSKLALHES